MRERLGDSGSFQSVARHSLSGLRFKKAEETVFCVCLEWRRYRERSQLFESAKFMRIMWHGQAAQALSYIGANGLAPVVNGSSYF